MIPMLSCLFCKRKRRLFNIYKIYGRTERPITSYIISFFGDVEEYLKEDHGICSTCVLLLNKLIYIKNFMVKTIIDDSVNSDSYVSFSSAYKLFLHNLDKLNFDDGDSMEDGGVSDLLKPMHSTPCEIDYDYSSDRNTPYIDKEVEKVFRPTKRKRRRSTKSTIDDDKDYTPCLRYDEDGRLLSKRTRSVSRLLNAMQEDVECVSKEKENFERDHVSHHELLAKYFCCECRSDRYTSLDFVHHKASEEMTSFYRVDYNEHPNNNLKHVSEVTTGDFHVKVLIQKGKINESPILRFQESPEVITPSLNTSISQNSREIDDSELDTGQENSSTMMSDKNEMNKSDNSSLGSSEDDFGRFNYIDFNDKSKENKMFDDKESLLSDDENDDNVVEESDENKIIEENEEDKVIEENEEDKIIDEIENDKINKEIFDDKIIEESENDEEISIYIPSALEPERMVRDIIDTSSSGSESPQDIQKMLSKRVLKVDITRMIIDEALLRRLNRFPNYQRRRRSQESVSSGSEKNNFRTDTEYGSFDSD